MPNVYFIVFGAIAIINLANCFSLLDLNHIPCEKKPFRSYVIQCIADHGISMDLDTCVYTTSGVITKDGRMNEKQFRKIISLNVIGDTIPIKERRVDDYTKALYNCVKEDKSVISLKSAITAVLCCEEEDLIKNLSKSALCGDMRPTLVETARPHIWEQVSSQSWRAKCRGLKSPKYWPYPGLVLAEDGPIISRPYLGFHRLGEIRSING